jgi:Rod binding domain-containing protein
MQATTAVSPCSAPSDPQPRLIQAAHEFEAQLMKELLRPLTVNSEDDGSESGSQGVLGDFATEALGQSLSRSGGFGISASVVRSLSRNGPARECEFLPGTEPAGSRMEFK